MSDEYCANCADACMKTYGNGRVGIEAIPGWTKRHHWRCLSKPATVSTTCARCSATIDPAAVEQHHERCFRVGDWLRLDCSQSGGSWVEGPIATLCGSDGHAAIFPERGSSDMRHRLGGDPFTFNLKRLDGIRHIQRPGQAVREAQERYTLGSPLQSSPPMTFDDIQLQDTPHYQDIERQPTLSARLGHLKHGPGGSGLSGPCDVDCRKCQVEAQVPKTPTIETPWMKVTGYSWAPFTVTKAEIIEATKYDGVTGRECFERYEAGQREQSWHAKPGERIFLPLTPVQLAAARELWSLYLKQRISAAKERERLSVMMPLDAEDLPWR